MSLLSADDGFGVVAPALGVFGIGACLAQPAATAALMGFVLLRDKESSDTPEATEEETVVVS